VTGSGGAQVPAIYVSWAAVTDPTVESILIEWRPNGDDTRRVGKVVNRTATVAILQEGVVGSSVYQVRNTIIPRPARTTTPSAYTSVTTNATSAIGLDELDEGAIQTLENYRTDLTRIFETQNRTPITSTESIIAKAEEVLTRRGLKAKVNDLSASIAQEQTARIDGDEALAALITVIESTAADTQALLVQEQSTRASADSAIATDITVLESTVGTVQAGLSTEITTRANADSALSSSISSLTASLGTTNTNLSTEQSVRASADLALAQDITVLESSLGTTNANLVTEQTTRANADSALSSSITAVSARANQASAQGLIKLEATTAPSGVTARFGTYLRTTATGAFLSTAAEFLEIVSGVSRKVIVASRTVFADPAGTVYAMFDSSGAYFNNARIRNLTASNITAGSITGDRIAAGAITADKIQAGTITANQIVAGGISRLYSTAYSSQIDTRASFVAIPISVSFTTPLASKVLLSASVVGRFVRDPSNATVTTMQVQFTRNGISIGPVSRFLGGTFFGTTWQSVSNGSSLLYSDEVAAGTYTYQIIFRVAPPDSGPAGIARMLEATLQALVIYR
jgi:hypothetical protein